MADKYQNFADLAANEVEGTDYRITVMDRPSEIAVIAIHAGAIEGGTSELTQEVAAETFSSYMFEAIKSSGNTALHITSTHFDEPRALDLVGKSAYCLSLHGYSDTVNKHTLIGGADHDIKQQAYQALVAAGFSAEILPEEDRLSGSDPENICNKTTREKGLQLELSTAQRGAFFTVNTSSGRKNSQTDEFYRYTAVLKDVLASLA